MPVRDTMSANINKTRLLIHDNSTTHQFTDQEIQDTLDTNRRDIRYLMLTPEPTYAGNVVQYLDYYSSLSNWEDDATFWQNRITQVTPSTSEPLAGHWTFSESVVPGVYINGKTYDLYNSAADLLEYWIAKVAFEYDVVVGGQTFKRSQAQEMLRTLALNYRSHELFSPQGTKSVKMVRSDVRSGSWR